MDDQIITQIATHIIEYQNTNNLSLNEIFIISYQPYIKESKVNEIKLLNKTIIKITKLGYDIVSTHPLKLERFL